MNKYLAKIENNIRQIFVYYGPKGGETGCMISDLQIATLLKIAKESYSKGREEVIEEIDNIMDSEKAKDQADTLEQFLGSRSCNICGFSPEHQREFILGKLKQNKKE